MDLTPEQRQVLGAIISEGQRRKVPRVVLKSAIETGLVESGLRNLNYGDADSQGWRQERTSLYPNPTNLKASVGRYFDEAMGFYGDGQYNQAGALAADVQRPAEQYRGRYHDVRKQAGALLRQYTGGQGSAAGNSRFGAPPQAAPTSPRPQGQAASPLDVPPPDVSSLAALLQSDQVQQHQSTPIAPPEFSASRYVTGGMGMPSRAPVQDERGGLAAQLAAVQGLVGTPSLAAPGESPQGRGGRARPDMPARKTLVIGDSLEVGTLPELKEMLGNKVKGIAVGGKPSTWGVDQLRSAFKQGQYGTVVFDMGTNDATAAELKKSLSQVQKIVGPDTRIVVSTVNSPWAEGQKNQVIRQFAKTHPNVELVRWKKASAGGSILPDGIHGAYDKRAGLLADALGYTPPPVSKTSPSQFPTYKTEGMRLARPETKWNPEGNPMAPWLAQALDWASKHGWSGTVSSGYRTGAEQLAAATSYGLEHYPNGPQASNHRSGNAVDVTDAEQLAAILEKYPGRKPIWAGPTIGDWVHFSDNGH